MVDRAHRPRSRAGDDDLSSGGRAPRRGHRRHRTCEGEDGLPARLAGRCISLVRRRHRRAAPSMAGGPLAWYRALHRHRGHHPDEHRGAPHAVFALALRQPLWPRLHGEPRPRVMDVELITVGDELLLGFTIDTNAAHLARELAAIGIGIRRRGTVGDVAEDIATAVREALDRTGAVITTGGLGPTSDDLTKPSIAAIFGRGMQLDEEHVAWMEQRWQHRFGRKMPESNRAQAMLPEGARKLTNNHGSAPGIWLEDDRGRWVAMLPGVPREMRGMLADTLLPLVRDRLGGAGLVVRSRTLRTTGI